MADIRSITSIDDDKQCIDELRGIHLLPAYHLLRQEYMLTLRGRPCLTFGISRSEPETGYASFLDALG